MNQALKQTGSVFVAALAAVFVFGAHSYADGGAQVATTSKVMNVDEMYFTVGAPKVELVAEGQLTESMLVGVERSLLRADGEPTGAILAHSNEAQVILDQIINMGKKIWNIIEANKPVVNVQTDVASALPEGARSWQSLSGWKAPQSRRYRVTYTNLFGVNVVDFSYLVVYTPGGNVGGKGQYLTHVTVLPAGVDVAWGYNFDMQAAVPSVTNSGTSTDPVGAAQLQLSWKVNTPLKHSQSTQSFYVQGTGAFMDLSNGTR